MPPDAECLVPQPIAIPAYLRRIYWWAYVHPQAVRVFERQWLVNLILWGNFGRLRDAALEALGPTLPGRTLQIACVYGDLTSKLLERSAPGSTLDVVDILPLQLENLKRKLPADSGARLRRCNSAGLDYASGTFDRALLFFLLHEMPESVRRATLAQALRVVKPGGRLVIVDYHRPRRTHPLYLPMVGILRTLEPFALDLWEREVPEWFPDDVEVASIRKTTSFGGLYQMLEITV